MAVFPTVKPVYRGFWTRQINPYLRIFPLSIGQRRFLGHWKTLPFINFAPNGDRPFSRSPDIFLAIAICKYRHLSTSWWKRISILPQIDFATNQLRRSFPAKLRRGEIYKGQNLSVPFSGIPNFAAFVRGITEFAAITECRIRQMHSVHFAFDAWRTR